MIPTPLFEGMDRIDEMLSGQNGEDNEGSSEEEGECPNKYHSLDAMMVGPKKEKSIKGEREAWKRQTH